MSNITSKLIWLYFFFLFTGKWICAQVNEFSVDTLFEIVYVHNQPVITKGDIGTENNLYGFEGGRAFKLNGEYHLFTTEMSGLPIWTKTRLAHWTSKNGLKWKRISTLFESSGNFDGTDTHACLWSPMPIFDENENRWVLTYVAYRSKPNTDEAWYRNYEGRIAIAVSQSKGLEGIYGPYKEVDVIMEPGEESAPWEGLMGVDSFFPFRAGDSWIAFYGSSPESNGLAQAGLLFGPWKRISAENPISRHTENPVVTQLDDGRYIAFFDGCGQYQRIGYMLSEEGLYWSKPQIIDLNDHQSKWWELTRTPLGLIPEGKNNYTLYFTAYNKNFYEIPGIWSAKSDTVFNGFFASVGMLKLRIPNIE